MKIALVTDQPGVLEAADARAYPLHPARRVLPLARALASLGQQVTVYSRQDPAAPADTEPCPGVVVRGIPAGPLDELPAGGLLPHVAALAGQLADRWSADPPDVIHAHFWTGGLAALAGARGLGIPVVQTFYSLAADAGPGRPEPGACDARARLERAIGRSTGGVIAVTNAERAALARLGVPRQSVRVVPSGVDVERYRPSGPSAERDERPRLLMVSPPGDRHGPITALHALADVAGAELVITGDAGQEALTRLARRLGVHDRVSYADCVTEAGMPPLMRSADVLVHLTARQRYAIVPLEAMACGTPVIAAEDAATGDAVIHGNTGFLVPPGEPEQLARRIRELLASRMLLEGYGIAAASRIRSRYSWERVGQETLAVYESLLGPPVEAAA